MPTPRAIALRERVHVLARDVRDVLSPQEGTLNLATLERTFTIRANDGFIALFSAPLMAVAIAVAPHARLRFAPKPVKEAGPLRDGTIDLEIGVLGDFAPEVRTHLLFRDRFVGVVRKGHPLLSAPVTPERYAAARHTVVSRRGQFSGPVDDALETLGLTRKIVAVVPGFLDALRIARQSDLVALVTQSCLSDPQFEEGLVSFPLPMETPEIAVVALWHPRMEADPAHRWLRETVITLCRSFTTASKQEDDGGAAKSASHVRHNKSDRKLT
ncbi:LysR substrate-binding domain-containing protein [Aureimonas altamirensis]|uniref:LysR substrate-binding domain-containing protein n=1 Tax=Aureimonas altamirensis TaxID=370622 RepID=UPI001E30B492|nr:LysR substrate-binding domain-containing protein [Aureimonas altamirensis]UHD46061.1 LysR substrate-binding domain-containing protein [Aureimonas altamirensis]